MGMWRWLRTGALATGHGRAGLLLIATGEGLIIARARPLSDFYFPFVWLGYILLLDAALYRQTGSSPFTRSRGLWLAIFPLSALFWWFFELLNVFVHNWVYIGGERYSGMAYVAIASVDFSTVVPAVWTAALFVNALLPGQDHEAQPRVDGRSLNVAGRPVSPPARRPASDWGIRPGAGPVPRWLLLALFLAGIFCLVLPVLQPRYTFGLIWGCTALMLDPINDRMGRPSMIGALWRWEWRLPLSFALGGLMCGFFWEAWNFWAMPKWEYVIPYVNQLHVFEMPLIGYAGYLPFGLELFAMANFVLGTFGWPGLGLAPDGQEDRSPAVRRRAS